MTVSETATSAQATLARYSAAITHIPRDRQRRSSGRHPKNTWTAPVAQRRRWRQSPRRVSGFRIQHRARGSNRMRQPASWRRHVTSTSSVSLSVRQ